MVLVNPHVPFLEDVHYAYHDNIKIQVATENKSLEVLMKVAYLVGYITITMLSLATMKVTIENFPIER